MKIIEKEDERISFSVEAEDSLLNAVRRYVSEIPVLAIEEVEIIKNDSPLYDETISHRLGLIPLKTEKSMNEKTSVKLKLSAKDAGMVYSEKLKGGAEIVYDKIPITSLSDEQELEIVATAGLGKGSEHSKFLPGLMFYRYASEITIDKSLMEKVKKVLPGAEVKEKGDKIVVINDKSRDIGDVCEGVAEKAGKKAEVKEAGELIVTIESFGQMNAKDIFIKSIEVLKKDLAEVEKKISK
jgi:DNA-directed RNA polymerase subunit D